MTKPVTGGEEQEIEGELPAFHGVNKAIHDRLLEMYEDGTLHPNQGNGLTPDEQAAIERIMKEERWLEILEQEPYETDPRQDGQDNDGLSLHEAGSDSQSRAQPQ